MDTTAQRAAPKAVHRKHVLASVAGLAAAAVASIAISSAAFAAITPAIQLSSTNTVPACVTPTRLMAYLKRRHKKLPKRFNSVAAEYRNHGKDLGVRWDYAFFQMIVETNYLKYRRVNGSWGDVRPHQNNFAGIGATGGGVPGEKFRSISDGVRAHIQHIKMYSGERIKRPVAKRTKLVQDWMLPWARGFNRPVTYTDLTKKWSPSDRGYSNDIEQVAVRYRKIYCKNQPAIPAADTDEQTASIPPEDTRTEVAQIDPSQTAAATDACRVWTAKFDNGVRGLLIRSTRDRTTHYTALEVQQGQESAQADAYIARYAPGGRPIAQFDNHTSELERAV
ncbi:MAG: glucosaminidase domain-containing protein, partial [Pseudomonadota bacterium]